MIEGKQLNLFGRIKDIEKEPVIQSDEIVTDNEKPERILEDITPKYSFEKTQEVLKSIYKLWQTVEYEARFEEMLEIILLVLERKNEEYLEKIKRIKKEVLIVYSKILAELVSFFTIDFYYDDVLGLFYMKYFSKGRGGEYYTPWNIALFMAEISEPKPDETVNDPCVGSGVMLLAAKYVVHRKYGWRVASRYGRKLYGQDISRTAVMMTKIQLRLTDYIYMRDLLIISASETHKAMEKKREKEVSDVHK